MRPPSWPTAAGADFPSLPRLSPSEVIMRLAKDLPSAFSPGIVFSRQPSPRQTDGRTDGALILFLLFFPPSPSVWKGEDECELSAGRIFTRCDRLSPPAANNSRATKVGAKVGKILSAMADLKLSLSPTVWEMTWVSQNKINLSSTKSENEATRAQMSRRKIQPEPPHQQSVEVCLLLSRLLFNLRSYFLSSPRI